VNGKGFDLGPVAVQHRWLTIKPLADLGCFNLEGFMASSRRFLLAAAVLIGAALTVSQEGTMADDKKERFFEMRIYTAHPGRLEAMHKRFREHTNTLFKKHGMELVGYWTPVDGEQAKDTLIYILAYPSREARELSWKNFQADPVWKAAYKASHDDGGPIVKKVDSKFLSPTDYSPIK